MTGYETFTIYQALKLHFTQDSFDLLQIQRKNSCLCEMRLRIAKTNTTSTNSIGRFTDRTDDLILTLLLQTFL
jgi:hypothetical protein